MNKLLKKLNTLRHLDWKWAFRFYRKKTKLHLAYIFSILKNEKFFEINVDGAKVKLTYNHYYHHHKAKAMSQGRHEIKDLELWKKKSESRNIVYDIGGYNGIYGLVSAIANPESIVYIFEPEPINCDCIKKNIELNGLKNVKLIQGALSNKTRKVMFDMHRGGTGGKIAADGEEIDCWKLDDFIEENEAPTLIKCDIEGAEYLALTGARETLAAKKPEILLEVHKKFLSRFGHSEQDVYDLLDQMGFKKDKIDETGHSIHYWVSV